MDEILNKIKLKMKKTIDDFSSRIVKLRTGRANPLSLYGIKINYYDELLPLEQISNITSPDPLQLLIKPYDVSFLKEIYKNIVSRGKYNAKLENDVIRIKLSPMTSDNRQKIIKELHIITENHRIALRQIRHQEINIIKKNTEFSEDQAKGYYKKIDQEIDNFMKEINEISQKKEKEINHI